MAGLDRIFGSDLPGVSAKVGSLVYVDGQIFNFKDDISQRLALDHYMDGDLSQISGSQEGRHRQITMLKNIAPAAKDDSGVLYSKDDSGDTELFYKDDLVSGNEIKLSEDGDVNIPDILSAYMSVFESISIIEGNTAGIYQGRIESETIGGAATIELYYKDIDYPLGFTKENSVVICSKVDFGSSVFGSLDGPLGIYYSGGIPLLIFAADPLQVPSGGLALELWSSVGWGSPNYSKIVLNDSSIRIITVKDHLGTSYTDYTYSYGKEFKLVLGKLV